MPADDGRGGGHPVTAAADGLRVGKTDPLLLLTTGLEGRRLGEMLGPPVTPGDIGAGRRPLETSWRQWIYVGH